MPQVNYANLASVSTTIFARVLFGPLSDRFGPKRTMSAVLLLGAIPVFCVGSISTWQHLVAVRSAIGLLGASFVMSQSWTSNMFSHNVVGTANAIVGGWGNLGEWPHAQTAFPCTSSPLSIVYKAFLHVVGAV